MSQPLIHIAESDRRFGWRRFYGLALKQEQEQGWIGSFRY